MQNQISLRLQRIVTVASIAFCLLFIWSFQKKRPQTFRRVDPAFSAYIYAYSSGELGRRMPIRVRFTESVASRSLIGTEVPSDVIDFSPAIAGKAIWEDANTIRFTPAAPLTSNEFYTGNVHLDHIFKNVPARFKDFIWDFRPVSQTITVTTTGFVTPSSNDYSKQIFKGTLTTADYAEDALVEQSFQFLQTGNDAAKIEWKHDTDHKTHHFTINNIIRTSQKSELKLWWNGQLLDCTQKGDKNIEVAAINNFKLLEVAMNTDESHGSPHAVLQFSDPLKTDQNLDGLVTVAGQTMSATIDGNNLLVYPPAKWSEKSSGSSYDEYSGTYSSYNNDKPVLRALLVHTGIKNSRDSSIQTESNWQLEFGDGKPAVRLVGDGVIIPNSTGLLFPFDATQLKAVDVEIFKINQANVVHFLQQNELNGNDNYRMRYFGSIVFQKKINLDEIAAATKDGRWTRYALDLKDFVKNEPGAIYQVRIGFRKSYAVCNCEAEKQNDGGVNLPKDLSHFSGLLDENDENQPSILEYYEEHYYEDGGNNDDKNPCNNAYYRNNKFIVRNILATDLGVVAKRGQDGSLTAAVTNISSTDPVEGVTMTWCDIAGSVLAQAKTDKNGFAVATAARKPVFLIANKEKECTYLKLDDGYANSLSKFNVDGGEQHNDGLNGYLYGERGVWRPGDSMYLTFVLQDKFVSSAKSTVGGMAQKGNKVERFFSDIFTKKTPTEPENRADMPHPVTLELFDPQGKLHRRIVKVSNEHGLYDFRTATDESAETGAWEARVSLGNAVFSKTLKVETVKPNRLKIKLDWGKEALSIRDTGMNGKLNVAWLHGAIAKNLQTDVQMTLMPAPTRFEGYNEYSFIDPTKTFSPEPQMIFDAPISAEGTADIPFKPFFAGATGLLQGRFYVRSFEKGGDMSFNNFYLPISPFTGYVGIKPPKYEGRNYLNILRDNTIDLVTVDEKGKPQAGDELEVRTYRLTWSWWWDSREESSISGFRSSTVHDSIDGKILKTNSLGKATYTFKPKTWGRYFIVVENKTTGHSTGTVLYTDYKREKGDQDLEEQSENPREAAAKLVVSTDKESYKTGENITLTVPTGEKGRVLVSLENGSRVLQQFWATPTKGQTKISFAATPEMSPNIYANITYIQPHAQVQNDLPIRLYGAIPIIVENPAAHLLPTIEMADKVRPEEPFNIKIKETNGQAMAYTVDIVDEGLLDLTGFKTPNPYNTFYEKEALGVKTWDVYDFILGAFGNSIQHILSLGGDETNAKAKGRKANRFKPAVVHLGPFYVAAGATASHSVTLPNYVGSVRVMVVAAQQGVTAAYGATDKTVSVQKPLMLLATAPRILSPTESIKLPVDIFAMEPNIKNVHVSLETNDCFEVMGESKKDIRFDKPGDETISFDLKVKEKIGIAKIKVIAVGNGETSRQEIELDVRNPNQTVTEIKEAVILPNKSWEESWKLLGVEGTNKGVLELSTMPSINLASRLDYLLQYPHGCIEQTTSGAFPQLYVGKLTPLTKKQEKEIGENLESVILTLRHFQTPDGGFGYWEGDRYASVWGTSYAGHFLLEAQAQGYTLPPSVLDNWISFQQRLTRAWTQIQDIKKENQIYDNDYRDNEQIEQAYRLYTLALATKPETGAMNRLQEMKNLCAAARWRLAAAYAIIGKPDIAASLTKNLNWDIKPYRDMYGTFGSDLRDQAMILETLTLMQDQTRSALVAKSMAQKLGKKDEWYSTQSTAYALLAIAKYANGAGIGEINCTYQLSDLGKIQLPTTKSPIISIPIENIDKNTFRRILLENKGKGTIYARLILSGQPAVGNDAEASHGIAMSVRYKTLKGDSINIEKIPQGTDFIAEITIKHANEKGGTYSQMALAQIFPSGWEIHNSNLMAAATNSTDKQSSYTFRNTRDDRVNTYFNIEPKEALTYRVQLNAAYQGRYYLPAIYCEAMYDASISARRKGRWVEVAPDESEEKTQ